MASDDEVGLYNPFGRGNVLGRAKKKKRRITLGLSPVVFSATSGNELEMQCIPQKSFTAKRMVLDAGRVGTTATGLLTITAQTVMGETETAGSQPTLFSAYSSVAVGAAVDYRECYRGLTIAIRVRVSPSPETTDTITCSGHFYGIV